MVETFVNVRPKKLLPKRVLKFADAERHTREAVESLEEQDISPVLKTMKSGIAWLAIASQKALDRFDATMREFALGRYNEVEAARAKNDEVYRGLPLPRPFACLMPPEGLTWPPRVNEDVEVHRIAKIGSSV